MPEIKLFLDLFKKYNEPQVKKVYVMEYFFTKKGKGNKYFPHLPLHWSRHIAKILGMTLIGYTARRSEIKEDENVIGFYQKEVDNFLNKKKEPNIFEPKFAIVLITATGNPDEDTMEFWRDDNGRVKTFPHRMAARQEFNLVESMQHKYVGVIFEITENKLEVIHRIEYRDKQKQEFKNKKK